MGDEITLDVIDVIQGGLLQIELENRKSCFYNRI